MNELEKLKFSKFCTADLSSRDNNNNEWKNKFTRERNHFGQDNSLFETYKQDNCPIFFCNTNIETFSWAILDTLWCHIHICLECRSIHD